MPTQDRTVQLPDKGQATMFRLTDHAVRIDTSDVPSLMTLVSNGSRYGHSPESWALIIPELVAALPANLRDDVANAICAMACGVAS